MYRIFCESYKNYIENFLPSDSRAEIAEPLGLIADVNRFEQECKNDTAGYRRLCDVLYYAEQNLEQFPRLKAFLWTISSRGMEPKYYGTCDDETLREHVKLINSFLKLAYWA